MLAAVALHLKGSEKRFVSPGPLINEFPLNGRSLSLSILAGTRRGTGLAFVGHWKFTEKDGSRRRAGAPYYVKYFALQQNFRAITCRAAFAQ